MSNGANAISIYIDKFENQIKRKRNYDTKLERYCKSEVINTCNILSMN